MANFSAHESSYVDEGAVIGDGTKIWHFSHVMTRHASENPATSVRTSSFLRTSIIGNNVKIQNNVSVYTGVILEDDVFCGPSMVFTNVINPRSHVSRKHEYQKTVVGRGASLGANSTVVCGHNIGRYAFIGAGAVVTRDVPDYALVVGNPGTNRRVGLSVRRQDWGWQHPAAARALRRMWDGYADGQPV